MGACKNRLCEAVLTSTYNLCSGKYKDNIMDYHLIKIISRPMKYCVILYRQVNAMFGSAKGDNRSKFLSSFCQIKVSSNQSPATQLWRFIMRYILFAPFRCFKKCDFQLLAKVCTPSTGYRLSRYRQTQEQLK